MAAPEISAWENLTDIQQKRLILCALNNLSGLKSEAKYVYGGYIRNNAERLLPLLADNADICRMEFFAHEGILSPSTYSAFLDLTRSRAEITAWLLDYCNRNFSVQIIENEFEKELSEIFSL